MPLSRIARQALRQLLKNLPEPKRNAKTGQYVGAPAGVDTPEKLLRNRENYYELMEEGLEGRHWYHDTSAAIAQAAPDPPLAARTFGRTSQGSGVDPNTGWGIKALNQLAVGDEVQSGRFPAGVRKSLESDPYATFGPKLEPYAQHLTVDWDPTVGDRPVHDIWDGRAWGFVNKDGTPWDQGFSPTQHEFMDHEAAIVRQAANDLKLGGYDDWDNLSTQAAAWTGGKIRTGEVKPEDAAKHYADYFAKNTAHLTRETVPGSNTGHMQGLLDDPDLKRLYDDEVRRILYGEGGQTDPISRAYGMMQPGTHQGVGIFEGDISPNTTVQALAGRAKQPFADRELQLVDPASRELLDASEATYGLLTGQKAYAWNQPIHDPKIVRDMVNMGDVRAGRPLTDEEMLDLTNRFGAKYGEDVAITPTPEGARVFGVDAWKDEPTAVGKPFIADVNETIGDVISDDVDVALGRIDSGYGMNPWELPEGRYGQSYLETIDRPDRPNLQRAFDDVVPRLAAKLEDLDRTFAQTHGLDVSPHIQNMRRALAKEGLAGLKKLIKTGTVPAALIAAFVADEPALAQELGMADSTQSTLAELQALINDPNVSGGLKTVAQQMIDEGDYRPAQMGVTTTRYGSTVDDTPQGISPAQSRFVGTTEGATVGFGDEIMGATMSALSAIPGAQGLVNRVLGYDPGYVPAELSESAQGRLEEMGVETPPSAHSYEGARNVFRRAQGEALEANPWNYMGGAAAGGVPLGIGGMIKGGVPAAAQQGLRHALPRLAGIGAVEGGIGGYGVSEGETIGEQAADTVLGAGAGAILSPAIPVLGTGAAAAGRGAKSGAQAVGRAFSPPARARNRLLRDLMDAGMSQEDAARRLAQNPDLVIGDLSENLQRRVGAMSNAPGETPQAARAFLDARSEGMFGRFEGLFRRAWGGQQSVYDAAQGVVQSMREQVSPIYDEIYQRVLGPATQEKLKGLLRRAGPRVLRHAQELARTQGVDIDLDGPMNVRTIDYVQRALRKSAEESRMENRWGNFTDLGAAQNKLRGELIGAVEADAPDWKRARRIWRGQEDMEDAERIAKNIFNERTVNLERELGDLSESGRQHFKVAIFETVMDKMAAKGGEVPNYASVFNSKKKKDAIRLALGDEGLYKQFERMVKDENIMQRTRQRALYGSPTASNQAFAGTDVNLPRTWSDAIFRGLNRGYSAALSGPRQRSRDEMGRMLLGRNPWELSRPLTASSKPPAIDTKKQLNLLLGR